jgi:two-component system, cell cycle response regulator DivK
VESSSFAAPRIMIVDDNALNLEMASFLLKADGWEVLECRSAPEALAAIPHFAPQVVLMDIQMPGLDGLEATRRIKAADATRSLCVLAFTAYAMKGDEARMRAAGCDGYISKPIEVATFAAQVRGFLAQRP